MLSVLPLLLLSLPATTTAASSATITACVASGSGLTRIVASPSNCFTPFEKVVQFNQQGPAGPQGPVGPQGPQGPQGPSGSGSLTDVITVKDTGSADRNGTALLAAFSTASTLSRPITIQLDAATYNLYGTGNSIPSNVSINGVERASSVINVQPVNTPHGSGNADLSLQGGAANEFSNLTFTGNAGFVLGSNSLILRNVKIAYYLFTISGGDLAGYDSQFAGQFYLTNSGRTALANSQVDSFALVFGSPVLCLNDYSANGTVLPVACK